MSHQRRDRLRLRSRKTHSQVVEAHSLMRSWSPDVSRSAAERAISQSGRSKSSESEGRDQPTPSLSKTRRERAAPAAAASPISARSASRGLSPEARAENTAQIDSRSAIPSSYAAAARLG